MAWFNSNWTYRKKLTVSGSTDGSATGYVIPVVVNYGSGTDSGRDVYLNNNCQTDFSDIRFTQSDGATVVEHFREEFTSSSKAIFWVRLDSVPADPDSAEFYIYYENSGASDSSSGVNTFEEFEGGEDATFIFDSGSTNVTQDTGNEVTGSSSFDRGSGDDGSHTVSWSTADSYDIDTHFFECQILWKGSDTNNEGLTGGLHLNDGTGDTDGYQMYFEARSSQNGSPGVRKNADFNTAQTGSYTGFASGTFYFFRGYRDGSNNVVVEQHTDAFSENTSPLGSAQLTSDTDYDIVNLGFYSFTGSNVAVDNMRVRKKLVPEPSISSWGAQETEGPDLNEIVKDSNDGVIQTGSGVLDST